MPIDWNQYPEVSLLMDFGDRSRMIVKKGRCVAIFDQRTSLWRVRVVRLLYRLTGRLLWLPANASRQDDWNGAPRITKYGVEIGGTVDEVFSVNLDKR